MCHVPWFLAVALTGWQSRTPVPFAISFPHDCVQKLLYTLVMSQFFLSSKVKKYRIDVRSHVDATRLETMWNPSRQRDPVLINARPHVNATRPQTIRRLASTRPTLVDARVPQTFYRSC